MPHMTLTNTIRMNRDEVVQRLLSGLDLPVPNDMDHVQLTVTPEHDVVMTWEEALN